MKSFRMLLTAAGLPIVLAAGVVTGAADKDPAADLAKAPAAVRAAARKALGDRKPEEFNRESIGGRIIYEVGFKVGKVDHAFVISDSGELLQEETDVEVSELPAAVTAAVRKAEPRGKIDEAASATAGDRHFYVVDVKVGEETHVLKVGADGKVISDEIEKPAP